MTVSKLVLISLQIWEWLFQYQKLQCICLQTSVLLSNDSAPNILLKRTKRLIFNHLQKLKRFRKHTTMTKWRKFSLSAQSALKFPQVKFTSVWMVTQFARFVVQLWRFVRNAGSHSEKEKSGHWHWSRFWIHTNLIVITRKTVAWRDLDDNTYPSILKFVPLG